MSVRTVLISGGGIAGATVAYWLARHGFMPTVVERAEGLRSSGSPVDVHGHAYDIAERMGVVPQLRGASTKVTQLSFVDGAGRRTAGLTMSALSRDTERWIELPRADLASILYRAGRDDVEYLFHDSIATLDEDRHGVDVTFERAAPRRFDLVIGADGVHSNVRRQASGAREGTVRYMGMYVATLPLKEPAHNDHEILTYNTPGRAVSVHPARGRALAAFMFRRPELTAFDYRDLEQHKGMITAAFDGGSWRVPELLDHVRDAGDLYLDAVSRVSLPNWSTRRITLVGDAASSLSLFGDGSSLAITGAATLADALVTSPGDPRTALARYETDHRTRVAPRQHNMAAASRLLVPASRFGIVARNTATRLRSMTIARRQAGTK